MWRSAWPIARGVVLPAGEGAFGVVGRRDGAVGADPGAGVGLDADPVVVAGGFDEDVFARVAVGGGGGFGAGQRLVDLVGDGPAGLDVGGDRIDGGCRAVVCLDQSIGGGLVGQDESRRGRCFGAQLTDGAGDRDHVGFVDGAHVPYAGADDRRGGPHVPLEQIHRSVRGPAAALGEPARDGEVVQGDHRAQAAFARPVDHAPDGGTPVPLRLWGRVISAREKWLGAGSMRAHSMLKR